MPLAASSKESRIRKRPDEMLPLEERIRQRAYELFVQRGNQSGSETDDWLQAEEEMFREQEEPLQER